MNPTMSRMLQGWSLTLIIAALLAVFSLAIVILQPGVEGVRLVIRATARSSLLLFGLAFTASALWQLWPSAATRWIRRNRRYLGVAFASSHAIHLVAIVAFAQMDPAGFTAATNPPSKIFGGFAYVLIAAMTLTSFDRTAAMIGRTAWSRLHTFGAHYVWLIFAISYLKRTPISPAYWIGVTLVFAMLVLRLHARKRRNAGGAAEAA